MEIFNYMEFKGKKSSKATEFFWLKNQKTKSYNNIKSGRIVFSKFGKNFFFVPISWLN